MTYWPPPQNLLSGQYTETQIDSTAECNFLTCVLCLRHYLFVLMLWRVIKIFACVSKAIGLRRLQSVGYLRRHDICYTRTRCKFIVYFAVLSYMDVVIHADVVAGLNRAISRSCTGLFGCVRGCAYQHDNTKTTWLIITKLGRWIVLDSPGHASVVLVAIRIDFFTDPGSFSGILYH